MTLYAIYDPKPGRPALPVAVPERFSWLAAILPPVFLLMHGLWLECVAWVLKVVALVVLAAYIGEGAAFLLYVLAALWLGFAASGFRQHALQSRGWTPRGQRIAMSADLAQLDAMQ